MLFCLCTKFLYSEEPEYDAGKSGKMFCASPPFRTSVINASSSSVLFEFNKHIVSQYFSILFIFRIKEKSWKSKRLCLAFHV